MRLTGSTKAFLYKAFLYEGPLNVTLSLIMSEPATYDDVDGSINSALHVFIT